MKKIVLYITLSILILSAGCSYFKPKPDLSTSGLTIGYINQKIARNFKHLNSLKGRGKIIADLPTMSFTASANISLQMPDRLLVKLYSGFGIRVASLLIEKGDFTLFSAMENRVYYGKLDSLKLNQTTAVNIDFSNLASLLSGITSVKNTDNAVLSIDDKKYLIQILNENTRSKYWVDPEKFVVTDYHVYDNNGAKMSEYSFKHFKRSSKMYIPTLIKIKNHAKNQHITFLYEDFETNIKISDSEFFIKLPDNVKVKNL